MAAQLGKRQILQPKLHEGKTAEGYYPQLTRSRVLKFNRYIGVDYSGAQTPTSSLPGLRLFTARRDQSPREILPPPSPRKYWTRRGLAGWLADELETGPPAIIGIDHAFSFPMEYFTAHSVPLEWSAFLDDFHKHWPTDGEHTYVDFVRDEQLGKAVQRGGNSHWRRLCERRSKGAKSVFHFDVPGSVAKSTHAGLPWLRFLRQRLGERVHFWPFDGWKPEAGRHVIAEVYPSLWNKTYPREDRGPDQHDAYSVARWLQETDIAGELYEFLMPDLGSEIRNLANIEGWILGVR